MAEDKDKNVMSDSSPGGSLPGGCFSPMSCFPVRLLAHDSLCRTSHFME